MRVSALARLAPRQVRALAIIGLALTAAFLAAQAPAGGLEPSFRLPIAGRPRAPLVLDSRQSPSVAWVLSEDHALYVLSEEGRLLSKTPLPLRPRAFLALDGAGRALVVLDSAQGPFLSAWTRVGKEAFRTSLADLGLGESSVPTLALGSDERLFLASASRLVCLAQNGQRLWTKDLPLPLAVGPVVDGLGRPCLGLEDGKILFFSPYGQVEASFDAKSPALALSAFVPGPWKSPSSQDEGQPVLAVATQGGDILLLDRKAGLIARPRPEAGVASLASDGSLLYSLSSQGLLSAWTGAGALLWKASTAVSSGGLGIYASRLLVTGPGRAVSLNRQGEILREAGFANAVGASVPTSSGLLFSPGADWILGAYPFEKSLGPRLGASLEAYGYGEADLVDLLLYDPALGDSGHRLALLAELSARLDSGELGAEEGRGGALAAAVARGDFDPSYPSSEARFRAEPLPKVRALEVLGRLGSPENLALLVQVFSQAPDASLRSAACDAIGAIARDPQGLVGAAFARAIQLGRTGLDTQVALAMVDAMESLALRSGSPPGLETLRALLSLSQGNQKPDVKIAATRALSRIAGSLGP